MLVVRRLLTIMFTQKAAVLVDYKQKAWKSICSSINSLYGMALRSLLSKHATNEQDIVHVTSLYNKVITRLLLKSQPKNTHASLNMKPSSKNIALVNNFNG